MDAASKRELNAWLERLDVALSAEQWSRLEAYIRDVLEHNERVNLTADDDEAQILLRHIADGLVLLPILRRRFDGAGETIRILDIGAGAGFVGIALKIAWPQASVTLLESSRRKFQFLNWAASRLALKDLHVASGRAPDALRGKTYHAVLARALAALGETLRVAAPLVFERQGILIVHQSRPPDWEDAAIRKMLRLSDTRPDSVSPYRLPRESTDRHLALFTRGHAADDA